MLNSMSQQQFMQNWKRKIGNGKITSLSSMAVELIKEIFAPHYMLMKFIPLDKFDSQARQRCNFSSSSLLLQKIISLSSLSFELIKHDKITILHFSQGLAGVKRGSFFEIF